MGEEELNSPYLSLVLEAVLSDEAEFVMDSFFFERPSGCLEGRGI